MMSALKYLFLHKRTLIYLSLACVLTLVFNFLVSTSFFAELLIIFFLLFILIRIADDRHDYDLDRKKGKKQDLSKRGLAILYLIVSVIFVSAHVIIFGVWGAISLAFILYIQLEEKIQILQRLLMLLLSLCYFFLLKGYIDFRSPTVIVWLSISLLFPILFALYKRRKRK